MDDEKGRKGIEKWEGSGRERTVGKTLREDILVEYKTIKEGRCGEKGREGAKY